MKLVYLIPDLASAGGTIRVLHNKACWFTHKGGYEITVITTDQGGRPIYFDFPPDITIIDIDINYSSVYNDPPVSRLISLWNKRRIHRRKLSQILERIKPDITITVYPSDTTKIPKIKRKRGISMVEFHGNRFFRLNQGYKGIHEIVAKYRTWRDYRFIKKFDKLIVLTKEGAEQWSTLSRNIVIIPNAITAIPKIAKKDSKRVIAVGRLVYEKGFDRLIKAWALLPKDILSEWELTIFGEGIQQTYLEGLIKSLGIIQSASIQPPTKHIFEEYAKSSIFVMSSYSEGLPMVLIEAMSCGLPAICFDFPCGPKDVIEDGVNGFLVENGNIPLLSKRIEELIRNDQLRNSFSEKAIYVREKFSEDKVMNMWENLFSELLFNL